MNHPNRSRRRDAPGRSPQPAEIAQAREDAELTQTEAARMLYVSLSCWQRWEQGERRMHPALWEYWSLLLSFEAVEQARETWRNGGGPIPSRMRS